MSADIPQIIFDFFARHQWLGQHRDNHFVVAYSGGRDSTALLYGLAQLRDQYPEHGFKITAAYFAHPGRPLERDMEMVHQNCKRFNIPWVVINPNWDMAQTEAAFREERYGQLARLAHSLDATAVLTAHHQDDQVETLMFRLCRGTGIEGLSGIPPIRQITLSNPVATVAVGRPFLGISRSAIDEAVQTLGLRFMDDPTNQNTELKRNYLRHNILPALETQFPHLRQALLRLSETTSGELEIISHKVNEVWQELFNAEDEHLDEVRFNQLSPAYQRRIMRRFLENFDIEPSYAKVTDIIAFISGTNRKINAPSLYSLDKTRFLQIYRGQISIESPSLAVTEEVHITIPAAVSHRGLRATLIIRPLTPEQRNKPINFAKLDKSEIYVDLSAFKERSLTLRARRKGDRIRPLGMSEKIKLKRFLINRGIPRFKRDQLPVLAWENNVLWVAGVGMSDEIRIKDRPTHSIRIEQGESP